MSSVSDCPNPKSTAMTFLLQNIAIRHAKRKRCRLPLCLLAFIGLLLSSCRPFTAALYPTWTPQPTETSWPTPTAYPTYTAYPTWTSPPSPTPYSTQTPYPTYTPLPTLTATEVLRPSGEVQAYLFEMGGQSSVIADALEAIGTLTKQPKFGDADWRVSLGIQFARIRSADKELRSLEPPPEMGYIHIAVLAATANFVHSIEHMIVGIDEFNPDEIAKAAEFMQSGNEMLRFATRLVEEYTASLE